MKFTYNWLKDFVALKLSAAELAERLTMAGIEVVALEKIGTDWVFEIEITPNRPDLLSIVGIAREVRAILGIQCRPNRAQGFAQNSQWRKGVKLAIRDLKDCPLYTATLLKNIKVKASAPWLRERLELVGCRSLNNIVDITNYILFEYGQPLHAFDWDKIGQDTIVVRRADDQEELVTIDNKERVLNKEILVIANKERALAVAGIMGGKESEVDESTQNVLLESACFDPLVIRRGRQLLGLSTESSYRFERGVDLDNITNAAWLATQRILELAGGECVGHVAAGSRKAQKRTVSLKTLEINDVLGATLPKQKIVTLLKSLEFKIKQSTPGGIKLEVPSFRKDIQQPIDLVEEIARIWGYARIPSSIPALKATVQTLEQRGILQMIRQILISQGLNEVITYSLVSRDALARLASPSEEGVEIVNPLSNQQEVLRSQLLSGLLSCVAKNINQTEEVAIFEISHIFHRKEKESQTLGMALCGMREFYLSSGKITDAFSLLNLKGILELLLERLGITNYSFLARVDPTLKDSQAFSLEIDQQVSGYLGEVRDIVSTNFEIKNYPVLIAQLDLDKIIQFTDFKKAFCPLPLYPTVRRDISLVVKEEIAIKDILRLAQENALSLLKEIRVVDYYKGKQIPQGFKGLTLACVYLSAARTLTDAEVNSVHLGIVRALKEKFSLQIR